MAIAAHEVCPVCGSTSVLPIVYGLPGPELREKAMRDEVRLGGCMWLEGAPNRSCASCRHNWIETSDPDYIEAEKLRHKIQSNNDHREKRRRRKFG